jgi:hypothetical protein
MQDHRRSVQRPTPRCGAAPCERAGFQLLANCHNGAFLKRKAPSESGLNTGRCLRAPRGGDEHWGSPRRHTHSRVTEIYAH